MAREPGLRYVNNGFNLGSLCDFLAKNNVSEEELVETTREVGLARHSRPGTGRYILSRGIKHLGAIIGLGLAGATFLLLPDLIDGNMDLPANMYGLASMFSICGGYCDWYRPRENNGVHEVKSPFEMKSEFYLIMNRRYPKEVSEFVS